jgi:hypothetical protein
MGKPKLVCFDGNISAECIYSILNTCKTYNISSKLFINLLLHLLNLFKLLTLKFLISIF